MGRLSLIAVVIVPFGFCRAESVVQSQANVAVELSFEALREHDDPFNTVSLDVVVSGPNGKELRVPAFWAGGKKWKARYASRVIGTHRFRSECSDSRDSGLNGVTGEVRITPYSGSNPLYKHGPIQVAANHRFMQYADGTPFFWLGDTWWMGLCHRLHWPDEFKTLAADRKEKGFNVVQIVAGLYPDMPPFDPRGANEAGFPWEEKYERIRPEYFDAADRRIEYLVDQGFTPCIVGAWGYFMPWMGVDKMKQQWRYLIARYGAMPVVWCAAGEANLSWYLAKGFPYDDRKQVSQWTEVMRYIRATDPFHRPLTVHPTGIGRLSARNATDDPSLLDFDMLQTPHAQREAVEPTVRTVQQSYADKPIMPVIDGEAAYEMLGDNLPTKWSRAMFWLCMTNGAAGHTYGANGIWQCNRPGEPHGKSPHGGDYGHIPWNEAMNLPGSRQVALGKRLFERYEWYKFEPHPEWCAANRASGSKPHWGEWLWYPDGDPIKDAPAGKRHFRHEFEISDIQSASLWVAADNRFVAYLNGKRAAEGAGWQSSLPIDVTEMLRDGKNILAIEAENDPGPAGANPAGLTCSLAIQTNADESWRNVRSDRSWRCAKEVANGSMDWRSLAFDDQNWAPVKVLGPYGIAPWGRFNTAGEIGPYGVGIPGKVRIIYGLGPVSGSHMARDVTIDELEAGARYKASAFNPADGNETQLPDVVQRGSQNSSVVRVPDFGPDTEDWVLILERAQ